MIYKNESFLITGLAMKVYNILGPGFLEQVYQEALEIELKKNNIHYCREKELVIFYDGHPLHKTYIADFTCYDKIIVELKALSQLSDQHRSQVLNYLKATGYKLGLLYNFGNPDGLEYERLVF